MIGLTALASAKLFASLVEKHFIFFPPEIPYRLTDFDNLPIFGLGRENLAPYGLGRAAA